nr:CcdB family protein [Alteromonas confluentis]
MNNNRNTRKIYPYLVDIQHDALSHLATRLVVPLVSASRKPGMSMAKLTPEITIDEASFIFMMPQLAAVPAELLQAPHGSLSHSRHLLVDAIDFAVTGIQFYPRK